jgi:hypothetical protein
MRRFANSSPESINPAKAGVSVELLAAKQNQVVILAPLRGFPISLRGRYQR